MHSTNTNLLRPVRLACGYCAAWVAAVLIAAEAFGQAAFAPADARYSLTPTAPAEAEPASSEPLLSYRRDAPSAHAADAEPPTRFAAAPPLDGDANPLRTPQMPAQAAPIETPPVQPSFETSPVQPPVATPLSTPADTPLPVSSDPFAGAAPPAPLPQSSPAATPPIEPLIRYDAAIEPALHEVRSPKAAEPAPPLLSVPSEDDAPARRLAPLSANSSAEAKGTAASGAKSGPLPFAFSKLESFSTAGAGLAIVVGLFLICMWLLRRGGAKASGVLPADAFAVLGRAPLTSQSFAHLLRLGNKLVLVAMSADGIQPLTEVTDPVEVDRLTGLCASGRGPGPSAEFQQVLAQLSREPARGFLGAEASAGGRHR